MKEEEEGEGRKKRKGKGEEGARKVSGKKKMRKEKKSDKKIKKNKIYFQNILEGGGVRPEGGWFLHLVTLGRHLC